MALPTISGTGTLLSDPKTGDTRTGGTWTNAVVKFQAWRRTDSGWEPGDEVVCAAIAFDDVAADLARYAKGDPVQIDATVNSLAIWQGKPQLKVTVSAVTQPEQRPRQQRGRGDAQLALVPAGNGQRRPAARVREDRSWPVAVVPDSALGSRETRAERPRGGHTMAALRSYNDRRGAS